MVEDTQFLESLLSYPRFPLSSTSVAELHCYGSVLRIYAHILAFISIFQYRLTVLYFFSKLTIVVHNSMIEDRESASS